MSRFADRILREFPVRRTAQEKERFRLWLIHELRELGYRAELQTRESALNAGGRLTNVVAGDPERAKLILCAHYDTGIRSILPPLIMPTRPLTALLYQALTPLLAILAALALSFGLTFPLQAPSATLPLFLLLLAAELCYLRFGPSEGNNVNDNSSGVAALLETAAALTPGVRAGAAFVFLDGGAGGLGGAKGFRARYPSAKEKTAINLCCVAGGEELLILPNRNARWNGELLDAVLENFESGESRTVFLKTDGFVYFPSDNRAFKNAVTICGTDRVKGFGRLIQCRKAKKLDTENLGLLKTGLCKLISAYGSAAARQAEKE